MPNSLILQELKRLILLKNGLKTVSPSDCKVISLAIQKELKKNVSETTIKRLLGFASIKHKFSQFTINTLMEYVGYIDESQIESASAFLKLDFGEDIEQIRDKADRITNYTLLSIKNRCSVPYEMTVPRRFAKHDFEYFRSCKFSYTAFISQPGYGKSILVSHLVQEMFLETGAPYQKDIVMLINADHIFNKELAELTLEERIKLKLGLLPKTNLISFFNEQWQKNGIKFFLIVDGISDLIINKTTKPKIFDRIIDFIACIEQSESVKLIINMRSTTWSRFYEKIRHAYFLKSKLFTGNYFNIKDTSNVPPLTELEVQQIFNLMSPVDYCKISDSLKTQLKFPFHIQWYYQLKEEYPDFESYTNIIFFEIIARFINEKVYNATYSTEKVLFCKKMVYLTNYGRKTHKVLKTELIKELPVFKNAYMQLIADGILMEEKQEENGFPVEYVRFIQPHIFEYFLFIELYDLFDQKLDDKFFLSINNEYVGNQSRFQLLQWAARLLVKLNKFEELNALLEIELSNYEKNYLIYFIAENLSYRYKIDPKVIDHVKEQNLHRTFMKHLVHFDFVDSCYREAITCLIEVADSEQTALFYHATLGIFDCLSLNKDQIAERLIQMKALRNEASTWIISPYDAISLIYSHFWGQDEPNEVLDNIENFKKQLHFSNTKALPCTREALAYLYMFLVNTFYGNAEESIKIIAGIAHQYPALNSVRTPYTAYLLSLLTLAHARLNTEKADQLQLVLSHLIEDEVRVNSTLYAQSLLLSVKAEQSKNKGNYSESLLYAEEFSKIQERNDLAMHQLNMYRLILSIYKELNIFDKAEEYSYKILKLLDEKNISSNRFLM